MKIIHKILFFVLLCVYTAGAYAGSNIHHSIEVKLNPSNHSLIVKDTILLPASAHNGKIFELHADLKVSASDDNIISIKKLDAEKKSSVDKDSEVAPTHQYYISLKNSGAPFTLTYKGKIFDLPNQSTKEYARSASNSNGVIDEKGVFLAKSSRWFPNFNINKSITEFLTFDLTVEVPINWSAVSQGRRTTFETKPHAQIIRWQENNPQDDIYLIAAPFVEYQQTGGLTKAMVFLRKKDDALAQKYLDATDQYIAMYNRLLGPYPYEKFALVENFWETGYGMPSFTLLGSKIIRFPFILHSSYPHEILHNWWGNSVFVDYKTGNWAEGLTAYLADHLLQEQRGTATQYRRNILQKYTDYVSKGGDFPLSQFQSRHDAESEAVGYGKTAMLFHMLRTQLGEEVFVKSLRKFYQDNQFKVAGFKQLQDIFTLASEKDMAPFFKQWVEKPSAPKIEIRDAKVTKHQDQYTVTFKIIQTQKEPVFSLELPIAIFTEASKTPVLKTLPMKDRESEYTLNVAAKPWRLAVDPEFDVFRRLDSREIPAALSQGFGAERPLVLLPSDEKKSLRQAYKELAEKWKSNQSGQWEIKLDNQLSKLPTDRAVWLLGWNNRFRGKLNEAVKNTGARITKNSVAIKDKNLKRSTDSIVMTARNPGNGSHTLLWVATDNVNAMPGLTRKLPHYGKYSYLAFNGDEPTNVAKGQWQVTQSPMVVQFSQPSKKDESAKLPLRAALIDLPPSFSKQRMLKDIKYLASDKLKGRGLGSPELKIAGEYIVDAFKAAGLKPGGDKDSFYQEWEANLGTEVGNKTLRNIIGVLPGIDYKLSDQSLIISAHYDHLGTGWPDVHKGDEGKIHNGADDNASGVAVLLEMARQTAKKWRPQRSIIFIAFTGEEAGLLGSAHYIKNATKYPANKVFSVLNLDTVGRLNEKPITIFGSGTATELVHVFRGAGYVTGIKLNTVMADIGSSDQKNFIDIGVPGVQFFSGANLDFHRPTDTSNKIDGEGLIKVAQILKEAAEYLANREEPLTINIKGKGSKTKIVSKSKRRVRLGTIPDFNFEGEGVRLDGVTPNSPAEKANLKAGDIIVELNKKKIKSLRDLSEALKALAPGNAVLLKYQRANKFFLVNVKVEVR